jgi:hypothetical protein
VGLIDEKPRVENIVIMSIYMSSSCANVCKNQNKLPRGNLTLPSLWPHPFHLFFGAADMARLETCVLSCSTLLISLETHSSFSLCSHPIQLFLCCRHGEAWNMCALMLYFFKYIWRLTLASLYARIPFSCFCAADMARRETCALSLALLFKISMGTHSSISLCSHPIQLFLCCRHGEAWNMCSLSCSLFKVKAARQSQRSG